MSDVFSALDALPMERGDLDNAVGKLGELPTLIAIVGSSGKSIASCALSSILSGQGKGVGLFLHCLPSDADRIYVNGKLVCESEIEDAYKELRKPIAKCHLSKEQALYLIALHIFASKGLDYGVVEFDVGGYSSSCYADSLRYEMTVLTSTGLDHGDVLGSTESEVALDCVSAASEASTLVSYELGELVLPPVEEYVRKNEIKWVKGDAFHFDHLVEDCFRFDYFPYKDLGVFTKLRAHLSSISLAIEGAKHLLDLNEDKLKSSLASCQLPFHGDEQDGVIPLICSNVEMAYSLARSAPTLRKGRPSAVLFACKKGCNAASILPILDNAFGQVMLTGIEGDPSYWGEDDFFLFLEDHPFVSSIEEAKARLPEGGVLILASDEEFLSRSGYEGR